MGFTESMALAERYIDHHRMIAGQHLVRIAPEVEDLEHNTDLMVLGDTDGWRVACRTRSHGYLYEYPDEFTIRSRPRYGGRTELDKIRDGWGDQISYGFAEGGADGRIHSRWFLGDLDMLRDYIEVRPLPRERDNHDGSMFIPFKVTDMPDGFLISASWNKPDDPPGGAAAVNGQLFDPFNPRSNR